MIHRYYLTVVCYIASVKGVVQVAVLGQALSDSQALVSWSRGSDDEEVAFIAEVNEEHKTLQVVVPNPDATTGFVQIPFGTPGLFNLVALDSGGKPLETSGPYSVLSNTILPITNPTSSGLSLPTSPTSLATPGPVTIDFPPDNKTFSYGSHRSSITDVMPEVSPPPHPSSSSTTTSPQSAQLEPKSPPDIAPIIAGVLVGILLLMILIVMSIFYFVRWRRRRHMSPSQAYFRQQSPGMIERFTHPFTRSTPRRQELNIGSHEIDPETIRTYSDARSDSVALDPELGKGYMDTALRKKERAVVVENPPHHHPSPHTPFQKPVEPGRVKWWKDDGQRRMRIASVMSFTSVSLASPTESEIPSEGDSRSTTTYGTVIHGRFDRNP